MLSSKNDPLNMYANEKGFIIPVMILCMMTIVIIAMFGMVVVIVIMVYNVISEDDDVIIPKRKKNRNEEKELENEPYGSSDGPENKFGRRRFNQAKMNKLIDSLVNSNKLFFMIVIFLMACVLLHASVTAIDSLTEAFSLINDEGKAGVVGKNKKM